MPIRSADQAAGSETHDIGGNFSDVVGAVTVAPTQAFDVTYRFRVDASTGGFRRQEIAAKLGCVRYTVDRKLRAIRRIWDGERDR